jgi:hypothetical protein
MLSINSGANRPSKHNIIDEEIYLPIVVKIPLSGDLLAQ